MPAALRLRAALKRGALLTAANWPLVAVQFVATSLYRLALAVPIVGGAFMVTVVLGVNAMSVLSEGLRAVAGVVLASLSGAPAALVAFALALGLVAAVAAGVTFVADAGTLAILADADRASIDLHRSPLRFAAMRRASLARAEVFLAGVRRFGRRFVGLGALLIAAYTVIGALYLGAVVGSYRLTAHRGWGAAWPLLGVVATSGAVVAIAAVDLAYALLQVIVACDDCGVRPAIAQLRRFLIVDARQVLGIFGVMLTLVLLATTASLLATAGLGLVAWVPLVGLIVFPLQAAAWLVRGLVFEYLGITAAAAYLTQYRRFAERDDYAAPAWAQHA